MRNWSAGDEEALVRLGTRILEKFGYEVVCFTDSSAALDAFRRDLGAFDVVLTDQTMPSMSGLELTREIQRLEPGFPVILITGYSELVDRETALEAGAHAFLMKPYRAMELAGAVEAALAPLPDGRSA